MLLAAVLAPAAEQTPRGSVGAPPVHAVLSDPEQFRPGEIVLKLEPRVRPPIGLGDGSRLGAELLRHGAVRVDRAFPDAPPAAQSAARSRARFPERSARAPFEPVPELENVLVVELSAHADLLQAIAEVAALPGVVWAEPNPVYRVALTPLPDASWRPDDRYLSEDGVHWSEGAFGRAFPDLYGLQRTRALEGWSRLDEDGSGVFEPAERRPGEGVVVAVVDTGVDVEHPDIATNVWRNPGEVPDNGIDDDGNGFVDDVHGWDFAHGDSGVEDLHGHGTHVAGSVAARADNGIGIGGVAPFAQVMPVKGLGDEGFGDAIDLANAVRYAADMGADIVSCSWGGLVDSAVSREAFAYARSLGVLPVAAAGNFAGDVALFFPAAYEHVVAVAAVDAEDRRAAFSNSGVGIDLSAPGVEILSLNANAGGNRIAEAFPERVVDALYLQIDGTSMACPHVSGAAAVLMSRRPEESADVIRGRLLAGAEPIDAQNPELAGRLGRGRLDLELSLLIEPRPAVGIAGVDAPDLEPGSLAEVVVRLQNRWSEASGVAGAISSASPLVSIVKAGAAFGDLPFGVPGSNAGDPFLVALDAAAPFGEPLPVTLELSGDDGYSDSLDFFLVATQFVDVSNAVGLPLSDLSPYSVGLDDFDDDGDLDAHFVGLFSTSFFRNVGGVYEPAPDLGITAPMIGTSHPLYLDADNDGDRDVFLAAFNDFAGRSRFFENDGGGRFSDVTAASGVEGVRAFTATSLDWDGDGFADLVGGSTHLGPDLPGQSFFLLHNRSDGTFENGTEASRVNRNHWMRPGEVVAFDYDDDHDSDLLLVSPITLVLYENHEDGSYEDVTERAGLVPRWPSPGQCSKRTWRGNVCARYGANAIAVGDYDNDGDLDVFLTGRARAAEGIGRNTLFRNDGTGGFEDVTHLAGDLADAEVAGFFRGNAFFDYDNDGDLDLHLTSDGTTAIRRNTLFRNEGDGTFRDVTRLAFGEETGPGAASAAIGDYDGDGALDVYAPAGLSSPGRGGFFRNRIAGANHWLGVRLEGVLGHRDAFGARVRVTAAGRTQLREVRHGAIDSRTLHFGLGDAERVDRIEIRWPTGIVQTLPGSGVDRVLEVSEPAGCDLPGVECPKGRTKKLLKALMDR